MQQYGKITSCMPLKWQLSRTATEQNLDLPAGTRLQSVHLQHRVPMLWATVPIHSHERLPEERRKIYRAMTGQEIPYPIERLKFLGTILMSDDELVLHYYEILPEVGEHW